MVMATQPEINSENQSLFDTFKYAMDQPLENMATTLQAAGFKESEEFVRNLIESPENYVSYAEKFINAQDKEHWADFEWKNFPGFVAEQAGQLAGSIASRVGAMGAVGALTKNPYAAVAAGVAAPALFEAVQVAGPVALQRAEERTGKKGEAPNAKDWGFALAASATSGLLNSLGVLGVMKPIGKSNIMKPLAGAGAEFTTEGLQALNEQLFSTIGSPKGLRIDTHQAMAEALAGGGTGGVASTVPAVADAVAQMQGSALPGDAPITTEDAITTMDEAIDQPSLLEETPQPQDDIAPIRVQTEQEFIDTESTTPSQTPTEFLDRNKDLIDSLIREQLNLPGNDNLPVATAFADLNAMVEEDVGRHWDIYGLHDEIEHRRLRPPREAAEATLDLLNQTLSNSAGRLRAVNQVQEGQNEIDTRFEEALIQPFASAARPPYLDKSSEFLTISPLDAVLSHPDTPLGKAADDAELQANWLMDKLNVKQQRNKEGKVTKAFLPKGKDTVVGQLAIDSGVANLLRHRKATGETVNKNEIRNLLDQHEQRFTSSFVTGSDTQHGGDYYRIPDSTVNLDAPSVAFGGNSSYELPVKFLPAGGVDKFGRTKRDDSTHGWYSDDEGDQLFWSRGEIVEDDVDGGYGLMPLELQSEIFQNLADTTFVSQIDDADPLFLRNEEWKRIENEAHDAHSFFLRNENTMSPSEDVLAAYIRLVPYANATESEIMADINDGHLHINDWYKLVEYAEEKIPSFKEFRAEQVREGDNKTLDNFKDNLLKEQPYAIEYGIELTRPLLDKILTPKGMKSGPITDLEAYIYDQTGDVVQRRLPEVQDIYSRSATNVEVENLSKTRKKLIELLPEIAEVAPHFKDMWEARYLPLSREERIKLQETQETRRRGQVEPDYPMKITWPRYAVLNHIRHMLTAGDMDYLYMPSEGFGQGGPQGPYLKAQDQMRKLAKEFDLPLKEIEINEEGLARHPNPNILRLDIRKLKDNLIEDVEFKGMKSGGLVMNYGDYGRSYK